MSSDPHPRAARSIPLRYVPFRFVPPSTLVTAERRRDLLLSFSLLASSICNSRLVLMTQKGGKSRRRSSASRGAIRPMRFFIHPLPLHGRLGNPTSSRYTAPRPLRPLSLSFHYLINIMELFIRREHLSRALTQPARPRFMFAF